MNFKPLMPDGFVPSCETLGWLSAEGFRLWRLSDKAADAHDWNSARFLMNISELMFEAHKDAWRRITDNAQKELDALRVMTGGDC